MTAHLTLVFSRGHEFLLVTDNVPEIGLVQYLCTQALKKLVKSLPGAMQAANQPGINAVSRYFVPCAVSVLLHDFICQLA